MMAITTIGNVATANVPRQPISGSRPALTAEANNTPIGQPPCTKL